MIRPVFGTSRWIVAASLLGAWGVGATVTPRIAQAQNFRLAPDDVLSVEVANHPDMSARELTIGASGKLPLPLIGNVVVAGKTVAEAQVVITRAIRAQLRQPQVMVSLLRSRPREVIVLGAVARPGSVKITPGWRVSEALAGVGGLSLPAEEVSATLARGTATPIKLDVGRILSTPQAPGNPRLNRNDVINVLPLPSSRVTVSGDVVAPKMITLRRAPRVLDALSEVGGLKAQPGAMRGSLLRGSTKIALDLEQIYADRASKANFLLRDGDLLSIETIRTNVAVVSFDDLVKAPGNYSLEGDATVLRAVLRAGGLNAPPSAVVASVRRGQEVIPVDLQRAATDPARDLALRDGDVVLLSHPEGPQVVLTGAVNKPGPLRVKAGTKLLDAIVAVGGSTLKPEQMRLSVLRSQPDGTQKTLSIDPAALFNLRDLGQNVTLQQGDLISLGEATLLQTVFVVGEVKVPGTLAISTQESLTEALLRAGGPTDLGVLSRVNITRRDGSKETVDASQPLGSDTPKIKVALQEGDIISVPKSEKLVLVTNAVNKPDYYAIPENGILTVGDAIRAAGGVRPGGKINQVTILRRNGDTVQSQVIALNTVKNGRLSNDLPLQPKDVVSVPEAKNGPSTGQRFGQSLSTFSLLLRLGGLF